MIDHSFKCFLSRTEHLIILKKQIFSKHYSKNVSSLAATTSKEDSLEAFRYQFSGWGFEVYQSGLVVIRFLP